MWAHLRELIFPMPGACLWCGLQGAPAVCGRCRVELSWLPPDRCPRCGRPVAVGPWGRAAAAGAGTAAGPVRVPPAPPRCWSCRVRPPAFAGVTCLGLYRGLLKWTVNAVKEKGQRFLLPPLAEMLARRLLADGVVFDLVTAPPLDPRRLRRRGHHPALALADQLAVLCGRPFLPGALRRTRAVRAQSGLTGAQRRRNLRGAAEAVPHAARRLAGRRVLLVDDVITTGSTLDAAARALLAAGAVGVWAAVLADNGPRRALP
ncbi:MAG: phosphoribosyltransferase family protein [Bacillota bacterium]|nr:ComF family protein [Bacillota bacterium]REJ38136.1 MAG: ComF family protein [Bacillota bacterium]